MSGPLIGSRQKKLELKSLPVVVPLLPSRRQQLVLTRQEIKDITWVILMAHIISYHINESQKPCTLSQDSVLKSVEGILRQRPNLLHKGRSMNFVKFHIGNQKRKNKAVGNVNSK